MAVTSAQMLPLSTVGAVSQPGIWQSPTPAGNVPTRAVTSIPFTSQRPSAFSASTYPANSAYRDLSSPFTSDRLSPGSAGLPNPSPGSGLTPQELSGLGGWVVDPQTGQLAYSQPGQNPAVAAAGQMAQNVAMPRPRPPWAPTTIDLAAISAAAPQGANPGMGGAMIGNGVMSPAIPPQQPPPGGAPQTKWADDIFGMGGSGKVNNGTVARANGTNGYVYGRGADGQWNQQVYAPINVGRGSYTPTSGASAYALANLAGQQNAQQKRASSSGVGTNGYVYQNGVNSGSSPAMAGLTPAQQYEVANGRAPTTPSQSTSSIQASSEHGRAQWEASKIRDRQRNAARQTGA